MAEHQNDHEHHHHHHVEMPQKSKYEDLQSITSTSLTRK